jgi:hypothetical protein
MKTSARKKVNRNLSQSTEVRSALGSHGFPEACDSRSGRETGQTLTFPKWQIERCRRLHRICLSIQKATDAGHSMLWAVRRAARAQRGRFYTCDASRPLRFGRGTILRTWYQWSRGTRSPESCQVNYNGPSSRIKFKPSHVRRFVKLATAPGVDPARPAVETLAASLRCSIRSVHRLLPTRIKRAVARFHTARRAGFKATTALFKAHNEVINEL